jgi:A/G-specific adenine glycosylase
MPGDCPKFDAPAIRRWRRRLLSWYDRNRRDLPWRQDRDPYRVWLSEIMLQQTRASAVLEHYRRFLRDFPQWRIGSARGRGACRLSGLGYYRRVRMMHAAAKAIVKQHGGRFPGTVAELRSLPGVGRYGGGHCQHRFSVPAPWWTETWARAGRVFGTGPPAKVSGRRPEFYSVTSVGDFNRAMMELGATVYLPRQPRCSACPVFGLCATRGHLDVPKKEPSTRRDICYALDHRNRSFFWCSGQNISSPDAGMWERRRFLPRTARPGQLHAAALHYCYGLSA